MWSHTSFHEGGASSEVSTYHHFSHPVVGMRCRTFPSHRGSRPYSWTWLFRAHPEALWPHRLSWTWSSPNLSHWHSDHRQNIHHLHWMHSLRDTWEIVRWWTCGHHSQPCPLPTELSDKALCHTWKQNVATGGAGNWLWGILGAHPGLPGICLMTLDKFLNLSRP